MTADWLHRYNHQRPHEALGRIPPVEYRVKLFPNLYFLHGHPEKHKTWLCDH